ncbi:hypothetical protein GCM10009641_02390 [Mycobacterium cookii]|uniref:Uncharacterized protein n=1 Tax=Mycobacterium cookii TaxID=1775 RepID=A0A7I7L2V9_9MYCO|nr:hypothetical protein MCOO_47300 [Mycobacterium cookii]
MPWACAVPANPKTSEAPKASTATVNVTAFRMLGARVVIGSFPRAVSGFFVAVVNLNPVNGMVRLGSAVTRAGS